MDTPSSRSGAAPRSLDFAERTETTEDARGKLRAVDDNYRNPYPATSGSRGREIARVFKRKEEEERARNADKKVDISWLNDVSWEEIARSQERAYEIFREEYEEIRERIIAQGIEALPLRTFCLDEDMELIIHLEGNAVLRLTLPKTRIGHKANIALLKKRRLPSITGLEDQPTFQKIIKRFMEEHLVFSYGALKEFSTLYNPNQ